MTGLFDGSLLRDLGLPTPGEIQRTFEEAADQLFGNTLRIAVTGLRQSGKTVFIAALAHHLLSGRELPFLRAAAEERLAGARLLDPEGLPMFPFEPARAALEADEPHWPRPTEGLASLRIALRFKTKGLLRRQLTDQGTLIVEIIDYPGEWLLDLPLLGQEFDDWSALTLSLAQREPRAELAQDWLSFLGGLDPAGKADLEAAARASDLFSAYLKRCQAHGLSLLQPGRFTMPERGDQPPEVFQFCPLPPAADRRGSLMALMRERYERYRERVVRRFYREHFAFFDRQVVLVDLLSLLNRGRSAFDDAERALGAVLESFRYGSGGLLQRLFRPRIDTLLFAATKADHVAHNQHHNLRLLLERLVEEAAGRARFEGVTPSYLALAALRCTDVVTTEHQGQVLSCVRGHLKHERRETVLFPGEIPPDLPDADDWESGRFRFHDFAPRRLRTSMASDSGALPPSQHIRLDQALEVLLGDRLQ